MKRNEYTAALCGIRAPQRSVDRLLSRIETGEKSEEKPFFVGRGRSIAAVFLAVILLLGVLIGGSRYGWFAQVAADEAEELVIDFGWSTVRLNRNLPDGYEVHLQSEYFSPDVDYSVVDPYQKIYYRDPANFPIPYIQVVNKEGQRVLGFWAESKGSASRYLNSLYEDIETGHSIRLIERDGHDQDGNRFVFLKREFNWAEEELVNGFPSGTDHQYVLIVDLAESKYSAMVVEAYGSEAEISRLYELVNVRIEEDYDHSNWLPEAVERFEESVKRGEFEITW